MRMLVVLNENPVGSHADVRRGLLTLKSRSHLDEYVIYPFSARLSSGTSPAAIEEEIIAAAADLEATAVLWCHTQGLDVATATFSRVRSLPSRPVHGYWEGDMYQWPYKPFPPAARRVACACDVVFIPGSSSFLLGLRRSGCGDVRYAPLPADPDRFGHSAHLRQTESEFDVVFVGSNPTSRIPLKTMPGARWRGQLVAMLEGKLGRRFAVYGHGWRGPCAHGPVPKEGQAEVFARSRATIGNNNLHAAYYFSDRLPTAMSCGAVTLHSWEPGFDQVFGHDAPLRFFCSTEGAWEAVRRVLETDDADLEKERLRARDLALARFTISHVQDYIVEVMRELWQARRTGVSPRVVLNPWLHREQL